MNPLFLFWEFFIIFKLISNFFLVCFVDRLQLRYLEMHVVEMVYLLRGFLHFVGQPFLSVTHRFMLILKGSGELVQSNAM
jgi:hypothetical protein